MSNDQSTDQHDDRTKTTRSWPIGALFDRNRELQISEQFRPHWSQQGTIAFITFRTCDSIPKAVLRGWDNEKLDWLTKRQIHVADWHDGLSMLTPAQQNEFARYFNRKREKALDSCWGNCPFKIARIAMIVADSLHAFDGSSYQLGDYVIMPNHVHLLAAFSSPASMPRQITSWLRFTATKINQQLNRRGAFWQKEPFDHLVRSWEQFAYLRAYIAENPKKANLRPGEYYLRVAPA